MISIYAKQRWIVTLNKNLLINNFEYFKDLLNAFPDEKEIHLPEKWNSNSICDALFNISKDENNRLIVCYPLVYTYKNEKLKVYHDYYGCNIDISKFLKYSKYYKKSEYKEYELKFDYINCVLIKPKHEYNYSIRLIKIEYHVPNAIKHEIYKYQEIKDIRVSTNIIKFSNDVRYSIKMLSDEYVQLYDGCNNTYVEPQMCYFKMIKEGKENMHYYPDYLKLIVEIVYEE